MREIVTIRLPENWAQEHLGNLGVHLSQFTRSVTVSTHDPSYTEIDRKIRMQKAVGPIGMSASVRRKYTRAEFAAAEVFHLLFMKHFEPPGELCGTRYDESQRCPYCGAGRKLESELFFDVQRIPKKADMATSIGGEWVVSQRLADLLVKERVSGLQLYPVRDKAFHLDDAIDYSKYATGREILARAKLEGAPHPSSSFYVWLNQPGQSKLQERVLFEHQAACERNEMRNDARSIPTWHHLVVTGAPVTLIPPTKFGIDPFDDDRNGKYRCPAGHVAGLHAISELWIDRSSLPGVDISCSNLLTGWGSGCLVPKPKLIVSPRFREILEANDINGYRLEVAHLQ